MGYTVLHSEKGTSGSGGIGNHIDRTEGMEHSFEHSDKERTHLNINYNLPDDKHNMTLPNAINFRIEQGYNGNRKIRTDAVKFNTHILSGSHEDMKAIFKDKQKSDAWIKDNYEFMKKEFGEKNIVRFSVHLDEKTPHIHAVTVPLTADGRLSSKEVLGNKTTLTKRQDRYAEAMAKYGLERGKRGSGVKHEDAKEYYARVNEANKGKNVDEHIVKNKVLGLEVNVNKDKTIESLKDALVSEKALTIQLKGKVEGMEESNKRLRRERENYKNKYIGVVQDRDIYKTEYDKYIKSKKSEISRKVNSEIRWGKDLHKMNSEQKRQFLNTAIIKSTDKEIPKSTKAEIYNDKKWIYQFGDEFDKKAKQLEDREKGKGYGGGYGR